MNGHKKTQLQVALDDIQLEDAVTFLENAGKYIDIIEIGTPLMMRSGMHAVCVLREKFPDHIILCDSKIMDAGAYEAGLVYEAGADIATVLAVTDIRTIEKCVETAHAAGKKIMADMIRTDHLETAAAELVSRGIDIIGIHTGIDQQAEGRTPLNDLRIVRENCPDAVISVAGGIGVSTLDDYLAYRPDIIISGGGILRTKDPVKAAEELAEMISRKEAWG